MAAKRSRDARRMKENQIALRAGFLEKEVRLMKSDLVVFDIQVLETVIAIYPTRYSETFSSSASAVRNVDTLSYLAVLFQDSCERCDCREYYPTDLK